MNDVSYHGNPNLTPIGVSLQYTEEQIKEIVKCQQDPIYFIENYCYIVTLDEGLKLYSDFLKKEWIPMTNQDITRTSGFIIET